MKAMAVDSQILGEGPCVSAAVGASGSSYAAVRELLGIGGPQGRFRKVGAEAVWVLTGQAAAAAAGLVGVRMLTSVLAVESYGQLALGMTMAALMQQTILSPLSGATLRFFAPAQERGQLGPYLGATKRLLVISSVIVLAVALASLGAAGALGRYAWLSFIAAAFAYSLINGANSVLDGMQNAARQRRVVAWHQGLGQCLRYLLAFGLVALCGGSGAVAMWGFALGSLVVLGSQFIFFRQTIRGPHIAERQPSRAEIREMMARMCRYGMPFVTWGILTWAQSSADRWALQALRSAREVGLYQVLYQLGYYPILLASTLLLQLVTPIFFAQAGDGFDIGRSRRSFQMNLLLVWTCIGITVAGTLLAALLHGTIFSLFAAPDYRGVSYLLPLMVLSGGCFAAGQTAAIALMTASKTSALILPKIVTALCGLALSIIGAALGGIMGVLAGACVYSVIYLAWMVHLMLRVPRRSRLPVC